MRSVLLVDDEYFIRVRVRKCVDWQALGFDMVADCESGREALELLEAHPFDLVVLDISMPIMDGLSLCREIRARGYDSQLVILTGYDKFEYAKSALSFGVLDYILKPIDEEEMEQVVKKACERIDRKESLEHQRAEHLLLKSQAEQMKSDIFFSSILTDSFLERPETAEMLCQYGVDPKEKYRLICFREEASVRPETALPPDICLAASISLPQGAFWLIREEERQRITAWLKEWAEQLPSECFLGISTPHSGTPEQLHLAYQEARLIFQQRLLDPALRAFCYDDYVSGRQIIGFEKLRNFKASFNEGLRAQNLEQIDAAVSGAFGHLVAERNSIFGLHLFLENMLFEIQRLTLHANNEWLGDALFRMQAFELINSSDTLESLKNQLLETIAHCISQKNYFASSAGSLLIKKVEQIVKDNYMDANLGLSAISRALSLNASYLSDAFRRFHGQTLSQYITQVRMAKARDLLLSGELSLVEVMEQVGYSDPYYFSKRFKKFYGVSPSAYKAN